MDADYKDSCAESGIMSNWFRITVPDVMEPPSSSYPR